jgi:hypothetical protein
MVEGLEGVKKKKEEPKDWREIVSSNLEYYLDTEEGRKELEEMVKAEAKKMLAELRKRPRQREIIWLSKYCLNCEYVKETSRGSLRCEKHNARIVKPFYGRPKWKYIEDRDEFIVEDVDWNKKTFNVSELIIEAAINSINRGFPYFCYEPKRINSLS